MLGAGTQPDKPQHKPFAPHPAQGQDTRAYPAEANTYHHGVLRGDCWLSHGMLREVFARVWRSYDGLEMKTRPYCRPTAPLAQSWRGSASCWPPNSGEEQVQEV